MNTQNETRTTPWKSVADRPAWIGSDVAEYRIWQRCSQWGWEERHEWKLKDGTIKVDSWIRGPREWLPGAEVEVAS